MSLRRFTSVRPASARGCWPFVLVSVGLALLGSGFYAATCDHGFRPSRVRQAMSDVKGLALAVDWWHAHHSGCPTFQQLKDDGALSSTSIVVDPWGGEYQIACAAGDRVIVSSFGPDRKKGTLDDIVSHADD